MFITMSETFTSTPIEQAIRAAGGIPVVARECDVSIQAVHKWVKRGIAPPERCRRLEELSHGQVTRYQLRPDVFGEMSR
jgi:DNA-binding transcriptional regulator YdaS (Cro superfamily)